MSETILGQSAILEQTSRHYQPDLLNDGTFFSEGQQDFEGFKRQQREFIEARLQLQGKIESLQREFDFVSKLSMDEVAFIMERKRDQAARMLQRAARRFVGRRRRARQREQMRANAGMGNEEQALLRAYVPDEVVDKRRAEMRRIREKAEEKVGSNPMRFYERPMGEDRRNELKDIVAAKRRLFPQVELQRKYRDL
jgi:hypothetical protein